MAPQNDINELDLDDLTEDSTQGPDESDNDDVTSDNDTPDVPNDVSPEQPDGDLNDPEDAQDNPAPDDQTQVNVPGQIPSDSASQDSQQNTYLHQAFLYQCRALNELSGAISDNETNYSGLASELQSFFQSFLGRAETVWQNGQVDQSQADSLESNPTQQSRQVY